MLNSLIAVLIGFFLDLCFGDPHWFKAHPIRLIGNMIALLEKLFRKILPDTKAGQFIGGTLLAFIVIFVSTGVPFLILWICGKFSVVLSVIVEGVFCYFLFATKSLKDESMKVYYALRDSGIEAGRKAVSMIVGRDTDRLDTKGVTKATVETVAENTSDGVIAPMLYMIIGGATLGFFYKAINTMDSMIAYKNEKYLYFGKTAARLDDVVNFIPSRLSAFFMLLASMVDKKFNGVNAFKIFKRDRYKSSSPNSTQTESVCAGALQIQLLGDAYYFGKLHKKEFIGEPVEEINIEKIREVNILMYETAFLAMNFFTLIKVIIIFCL